MKRASLASLLTMGAFASSKSLDRWNWSSNIEYTAKAVETPSSVDEISELVKQTRGGVKVQGTAHSFSDIADTDGLHISLANLTDISVDLSKWQVTFGAGVTFTMLIKKLTEHKMALRNLPSLPHINVVGSVVTGTHGSGMGNQGMASYVSEIAFVGPDGATKRLNKRNHREEMYRYLHSFGALGIIYEMKMEIVPEFGVSKCIYKDVRWDYILKDKASYDRLNNDYSFVSYFTDWKEETMTSIWLGSRYNSLNGDYSVPLASSLEENCDESYFGGELVIKTHPVPGRSSDPCVESGFGMWNDKIYHFLPNMPPSSAGEEIQSEFFVDYADMPAAVYDLYSHADKFRDFVQITEIRGVDRDDIPLSPAKERKVMGIHFTWKRQFDDVYFAAKEVQKILAKYDYRVHWGKFFHPIDNFDLFSSFGDDLDQLKQLIDARGSKKKFNNCFIERVLYQNDNCQLGSNFEKYAAKLEAGKPEVVASDAQQAQQHSDEL